MGEDSMVIGGTKLELETGHCLCFHSLIEAVQNFPYLEKVKLKYGSGKANNRRSKY